MNGDGVTDGWSARRDRVVSAALVRLRRFPRDDPAWTQARDEAINAAIPLARRIARRFSFRGEELDDLTQVALVGLIKSVDRFDVAQGVRFERFAAPTMLGELRRHFRDRGWTLRVHRRLQELHLEINRTIPQLCQRLQRTPQVGDLATHLNRDPDEIRAGMACASAYAVGSLNSMVSTGGSLAELGELLGEADARLESLADQHVVRQAIAALPQRDRHLLALRFTDDLTQAEIAQRLGLSQMHVSRLLNRCFTQLRASLGDQAQLRP